MNPKGLTSEEVKARVASGEQNNHTVDFSRSYQDIIVSNIFTYFNMINVILAVLVMLCGAWKNMMFMGVVIFNALIAIIQECRTKKTLDHLKLLNAPKVSVYRDGQLLLVDSAELVKDDWMELKLGEQIVVDAKLLEGYLEVNESNLTGESVTIAKHKDDMLVAGSYVVSGRAIAQVVHVNEENSIFEIIKEVKKTKRHPSMLRDSLDKIVKTISWCIIPIGIALFAKQYLSTHDISRSTLQTVAALVGMIPEGLILLTSIALTVGVYKIAMRQTMIQEMYCLETLARVNLLCLDKTGTLTTGNLSVEDVVSLDEHLDIENILANMMEDLQDENATAQAIRSSCVIKEKMEKKGYLPFSSSRKYSGVEYPQGTYVLGAYTHIHTHVSDELSTTISQLTHTGKRVVVLGYTQEPLEFFTKSEIVGYVVLNDTLRDTCEMTLTYFDQQGVSVRIISGDDVQTVKTIAQKAGVKHSEQCVDASACTDEELLDKLEDHYVFGRVSAKQKKLMIAKYKSMGYVTAMVGDGVNDVMALKEADCSVAMASGAQASKDVANIVLLDNDFAHLPDVVKQGRQVIHNIERSASLFLTKTTFSACLVLLTLTMMNQYPFYPIQLTLVSSLLIGMPSFLLTFEPNDARWEGHFMENIFTRAVPAGLSLSVGVFLLTIVESMMNIPYAQKSTMSLYLLIGVLGYNLIELLRPYRPWKIVLLVFIGIAFGVAMSCFAGLFEVVMLNPTEIMVVFALTAVDIVLMIQLRKMRLVHWLLTRKKEKI